MVYSGGYPVDCCFSCAHRSHQAILVVSVLLGSWLGMQAVHESGHVLGAWLSGGHVARVVLWPLTISRTDLAENPHPLIVVWSGPLFGAVAPLVLWAFAALVRLRGAFVLRFFAGFCLLANGLYIGFGSFGRVGDCGVMLRHGSALWQLWLFGAITIPAALWLWHGQGRWFGLGTAKGGVDVAAAYCSLLLFLGLLVLGAIVGGR